MNEYTKNNKQTFGLVKLTRQIIVGISILITSIVLALLIWLASGSALKTVVPLYMEPHHERWVDQFDVLNIQSGDTVMLGDSLSELGAWNELFPQTAIRNRGITADTTQGVLDRLHQVTAGQPAQIFLLIGTNDLTFEVPEDTIVANIVEIVDRIHVESPETEVYVQSILPRDANFQERVQSLNATLEPAMTERATWINLYPLFLDDTGAVIDSKLTNDNLHLLGPAYLIWRDAIAEYVIATDGAE